MNLPTGLLILLAIVALALIFRGRKRRVGTDPHCRKCNYLLRGLPLSQGLPSVRCPECGAMLSRAAIVYGEPRRRVGSLLIGWLLLLGLGALVVSGGLSVLEQLDWYHYKPAYFVFRDLNSSNPNISIKALKELIRRDSAGRLPTDRRDRLVGFALNQQANAVSPLSAIDHAAINYLGTRLAAGDLPADQVKKVCEQSTVLQFSARPKVIEGNSVPYLIADDGRGPGNLWTTFASREVAIDDQVFALYGGSASMGVGGGGSLGSSVPAQSVGKHDLKLTYRIQFFLVPMNAGMPNPMPPPLDTMDRTFSADFEVFSKNAGLSLQKVFDPKLAPAMKAAIKLDSFRYSVSNQWIEGTIYFNNVPCNVAFDVVARYNGREEALGTATAAANSGSCGYSVMGRKTPLPPASVEIILRPSPSAASNTVNMLNYWDQEFDFPNVPMPRH